MKNLLIIAVCSLVAIAFFSFKIIDKKSKAYKVNVHKSNSTWVGKKVTGKHEGNINILEGQIIFNGSEIIGGKIIFDMASITCTDLTNMELNTKLVSHLKSKDFFGVDSFPIAEFSVKMVSKQKDDNFKITGDLTIKGITHEIVFPAVIKISDHSIVTVAKVTVDRTLYNIKYGSSSFFDDIGDKAISDTFDLKVQVVASYK